MQIAGPPDPQTLRHDQAARRQRIIRTALRALAASDNHEDLKISEIARDSGVALGTLYRYFASKEHLFAAVFLEWQAALRRRMDKSPLTGDTEAERLSALYHQSIRAFELQPQFFRVLMMMETTADTYAAQIYRSSMGLGYSEILEVAFKGPLDATRRSVVLAIGSVLEAQLRNWVMNRCAISDVYQRVDETIALIYGPAPDA